MTLGKSLSVTLLLIAMSNKKFMAIDHIAELNRIKKELNKPFTRGVLQKELKKAGIPSNPVFFACLSKYKIIKRVSRAEFVFSNNNPIYYKFNVLLKKYCRFCGSVHIFPIEVYKRVPKELTRVHIFYADGSNRTIDTGAVSIQ